MSPICGLINTPNLNFCLSSSKLKFSRSERVFRAVLHKTQSWMHTTRLNLLMQESNVHFKDSNCDSPISTNLMLTILASNASSSSTIVSKCSHTNFELDATLTLTKKNIMHAFTHRFARIFQSTFVLVHSRLKRSYQGL
ncbi:hypothetical protein H5410_021623 [Solanum commersonii]|uniref:Uncharacterized protein n=1 Tax=Solanum commersonii TaxID=4109 RepID=A0A9J5ZHR5_SOLCO|nr:hypothetical protein H5410_021623 [Solanum commersonii]